MVTRDVFVPLDDKGCHSERSEESGEKAGQRTANKSNLYLIEIQIITKIDCRGPAAGVGHQSVRYKWWQRYFLRI